MAAEADGVPFPMPSSGRIRALVGWIAQHPGPASRAGIATQLWPDSTDTQSPASLRTAIWSLRQAWGDAGAPFLLGSKTLFGLDPDGLWVDALADDWPTPRGQLLPGVDDDWVTVARDEHHQRNLRGLGRGMVEADEDGRPGDAVAYARKRCALAPLDEAAHHDLIHRLDAAGDRAGALLVAREFAERMRAELGVDPARPRLFG